MRQNTFGSFVRWSAALAGMLVGVGCGTTSTSGDPCGSGEHVRALGRGYCVYQGGIVIEGGFECPADLPFRIDVGEGVVCTDARAELDELPGEVCTKFESGCTDADPMRDGGMALDAEMRDSETSSDAGVRECDLGPIACTLDCTDACDGERVAPTSCCECPPGTFDRPTMCPLGLLGEGRPCTDDAQCASGLCFGDADPMGAFSEATCRSACLGRDDRAHYCNSDTDCCEGTCCIGCGELEGLCRVAPGTLGAGDACGEGVTGACGEGLSCCYPCGIPGCTNVCEPTCDASEPGCVGGCFLRP
ncbi:MAG: hypothetical protein IT379_21995 [Deltaproteobacteria bacterium]|nr:hypothetical protein [Deltaproteobacteria bacterium]